MTEKQVARPYHQIPLILFLFTQMFSLGTFLILFFVSFLTFEIQAFDRRYDIYFMWLQILTLFGLIASLILMTYFKFWNKTVIRYFGEKFMQTSRKNLKSYGIFLALLILKCILVYSGLHFHILDFIILLFALYILFKLAHGYSYWFDAESWNHPTTSGAVMQGALAMGLSMGFILFRDNDLLMVLGWALILVLILEGFTLWSRLRFLSKTSETTRKALRITLGSHITLFGTRFIFGLIMPLVYLCWVLLIHPLPLHPLTLMILVGELSERILFFLTGFPPSNVLSFKNNHGEVK
jgi:hypothetical protein